MKRPFATPHPPPPKHFSTQPFCLQEGKKTLFSLFLREAVQKKELDRIERIFGNPNIGPEEINYIRKIIDTDEIRGRVNNIVDKLAKQIDETILTLGKLHHDAEERLHTLVDYLLTRTK